MKSLLETINTELYTVILEELESIFNRTVKNAKETGKILDKFQELGTKLKGQKFSLDNKTELRKVFKEFINSLSFGSDSQNRSVVKKYGLATEEGFRNVVLANAENFKKNKIDMSWVKQFDPDMKEQEYKQRKENGEIILMTKCEDFNDKDGDDRDLVIYDRWDPYTYMVDQNFKGKRGKGTDKYVNDQRVQFHYEYGVKYYDCYPILGKNFFGHQDELKKRAELQLGYDDPNEFK